MHDLNNCMPDLNYCMPDLNYCGITAELLRKYCGITAELLSNRLNYGMPEKIHLIRERPETLEMFLIYVKCLVI